MNQTFIKLLSFALALVLISINVFASSNSESLAVSTLSPVNASGYVLMDADSGKILKSYGENKAMPMASTTKIMTCIIALEEKTLSDEVVIPKEAVGIEGSSVYLSKGEKLTLEDLLYALMLESANDAAVAIAIYVGGDVEHFAEQMNRKAADLGMNQTHYVNPHGLPADGHYSSALDLAKLMQYALKNEAFRQISATKSHQIPAVGSGYRYLSNHNKLLRLYQYCISGKTGYTREAGRCLVTAAEQNGKSLICVTLGAPNDWQNHMDLYEYGFSLYTYRTIVSSGEITHQIPVLGGVKQNVLIGNQDSVSMSLLEEDEFQFRYEVPLFCFARIKAGDYLGDAVVIMNDSDLVRIPLYALEDVVPRVETLTFFQRMLQNIKLWFV